MPLKKLLHATNMDTCTKAMLESSGGDGGRESGTPRKITSSKGFYRKCNLAPSP